MSTYWGVCPQVVCADGAVVMELRQSCFLHSPLLFSAHNCLICESDANDHPIYIFIVMEVEDLLLAILNQN